MSDRALLEQPSGAPEGLEVSPGASWSGSERWSTQTLNELYRDGICGGGLVRVDGRQDILVPLSHQSVLAGIMLATQFLVAADERLRVARPETIEGRYDVRHPLPKTLTSDAYRREGCICADDDFRTAYAELWR